MKTQRASLAALVALVTSGALANACSDGVSRSSPEPIASTESPIEGGDVINDPSNPISSEFPLSTVNLATPGVGDDGGARTFRCTGVIVSQTQILTAAHCPLSTGMTIKLYPTTAGSGSTPTQNIAATGATFTYMPGVCVPLTGGIPFAGGACTTESYYSCAAGTGCNASNGVFADVALITLASPLPSPYRPTYFGAAGLYNGTYNLTSAWEVGTGLMNVFASGGSYVYDDAGNIVGEQWDASNAAVRNASSGMQWVPVVLTPTDAAGSLFTLSHPSDHGDSGGPIYQYMGLGDAAADLPGQYNLALIGICHGRPGNGLQSQFTNIQDDTVHAWLVGNIQGADASTPTADYSAFGASLR